MSTLQLIWDANAIYDLWSWTNGKMYYTARVVRRLKNDVYTVRIGPRGAEPTDVIVLKLAHGQRPPAGVPPARALHGHPGEKVMDINGKVLRAAYAPHAAGVVHGDLADGHNFVNMARELRIIDFSTECPSCAITLRADRSVKHVQVEAGLR
ncbi:hypothetical protein B0H10DRAFT_2189967 [Mycena sp. CBHHK59/15]|nr:hypothetical protein B0H10DRAFT_2189967 [Mycena sp. CBHHK59/15]